MSYVLSLIPLVPGTYLAILLRVLGWGLLFLLLLALYATKDITLTFFRPIWKHSPLRDLKGPKGGSPVTGHRMYYSRSGAEPDAWLIKMFEKYGHSNVMKGMWNSNMLSTKDLKAVGHILNNPHIYRKSPQLRYEFELFIGDGIVVAEGDVHKRQRKVMNPAFGVIPIREMCKTFVDKAKEIREEIGKMFDADSTALSNQIKDAKEGDIKGRDYVETDMVSWISRAALDIVGLTGFNYAFNSVKSHPDSSSICDDELYFALEEIFVACQLGFQLEFLKTWIPLLRLWKWDKTSRVITRSHAIMQKIARRLVDEKVQAIKEGSLDGREKDLMTLLIKANLQEEDGKKMTEQEVLNQIPTFLIAAHESTATAIVWALHSLSNEKAIQDRLRAEIETLNTDNPTMDELNSLTFLEFIIRETLRFHSVGAYLERMAYEDDVIPFDKPVVDRFGKERTEIRIVKGDSVYIPIRTVNCLEEVWGPDARTFNPDRWYNIPEEAKKVPGIWGNQVSFLTGPKGCIGYRFAVMEMKAILYTLIRAFEFEAAIPKEKVIRRALAIARPIIKDEESKGSILTMRVRKIQ